MAKCIILADTKLKGSENHKPKSTRTKIKGLSSLKNGMFHCCYIILVELEVTSHALE